MNDPDQTMNLPVVDGRGGRNGTSPRRGGYPTGGAANQPATAAGVHRAPSGPTLMGAVRRYPLLVLVMAVLGLVAAAAYVYKQPAIYQATASVAIQAPATSQSAQADPGQYLDSQVLLLESQGVAQQAASIANASLGGDPLNASDFSVTSGDLKVTPPAGSGTGYGTSIVAMSFKGPSAAVAQAGLNGVLQAFDKAVTATIKSQAATTVAGIDAEMSQAFNSSELSTLQNQRSQTLINEQTDLANPPTAVVVPATRASNGLTRDAIIGLLAGLAVGSGLAFAVASRRREIAGRFDPAAIYGVPMIAETPAFKARRRQSDGLLPVVADPRSATADAFRSAGISLERVCSARGPGLAVALVSPLAGAGKSTVVANLALAMAEGGTQVLVVDADPVGGDLTALLLPDIPIFDGLQQALRGQRPLANCIHPSPFNEGVAVLGAGPPEARRLTGAARSKAASALFAEAKSSYDIVLIDTPALMLAADATALVDAADAAVIVVNSSEPVQDHLEMVNGLRLIRPELIGYLYNHLQAMPHRHGGSPARPAGSAGPTRPARSGVRTLGESQPSELSTEIKI